jgi:hypothetical protein
MRMPLSKNLREDIPVALLQGKGEFTQTMELLQIIFRHNI